MAGKRDLYEVLEVSKNASGDEIKTSYRRLAKKYHPDLNKEPGAEAKFKEVQEAYDILSDEQKRSKYDQFGHDAFDPNTAAGGGFGGFGGFGEGGVDLGDIFSSFFGGGGSRRKSNGPTRGDDLLKQVNISFMDSVKGRVLEMELNTDEPCANCHGTGAQNPGDLQTCSRCSGRGTITTTSQSLFGTIQQQSTCPNCRGKGKTIKNKCTSCNGEGYVRKRNKVDLNIPAGIASGQRLRVSGKGERGSNGGPNGDLYVEINVQKHPSFRREGNDIHLDIPISSLDATLGCTIEIPTAYGDIDLQILEGTQPGKVYRVRGKGFKDLKTGNFGDQLVHIEVNIPTKLSKEERDLYKQISNLSYSRTDKNDSVFGKFKKQFKK